MVLEILCYMMGISELLLTICNLKNAFRALLLLVVLTIFFGTETILETAVILFSIKGRKTL